MKRAEGRKSERISLAMRDAPVKGKGGGKRRTRKGDAEGLGEFARVYVRLFMSEIDRDYS